MEENGQYYKKLTRSLKVFVDKKGNVCLQCRFGNNMMLTYEEKYPLLLPTESHLTELLIKNSHQKVFHQDVEASLNELRSFYWITQGRRKVKSVLRKCVLCKRYRGKVMAGPSTHDLPDYRSNSSRAF